MSDILKKTLILFFIVSVVFVIYYPSLFNDFVNWDDHVYVLENPLIRDISFNNLPNYFTTPVSSNFHLLTIFSLAIDYQLFELDPFYYHLHNLILHIINTLLVFIFIYILSEKRLYVAALVAILFGMHPMHVESVAWISERKDVLYTFYFLLGLIVYLKHLKKKSWFKYLLVLILFILSSFAKSAAVIFPLVLLLTDWFIKGKIRWKDLINKIPFIIISVIIGIIAINTQATAIKDITRISMGIRIAFASYGFVIYMLKFILPYQLSTLHIFPNPIPDYYFLFIPLTAFILIYGFYKLIKRHNNYLSFGLIFYLITIVLVLQIITVGNAVIAERYTYVPYIGIAFIIAMFLTRYFEKPDIKRFTKYFISIVIAAFIIINSVIAFNRTKVWADGETLWKDVLKKGSNNHIAYQNLANYYLKYKVSDSVIYYDSAIYNFTKSISIRPNYKYPYYGRGLCFYGKDSITRALQDFEKAIQLDKNYSDAIRYRQKCLVQLGQIDDALEDLNYLFDSDTGSLKNYFDRGLLYYKNKQYEKALSDFKKVIAEDPDYNTVIHNNIGLCLSELKRYKESIPYFNTAILKDSLNPKTFFSRGVAYAKTDNLDYALDDFSRTIKMDSGFTEAYKQRAYIYTTRQEYQKACDDYTGIVRNDPDNSEAYYNRSVAYYYLHNYSASLDDALKARELGYNVSAKYINTLEMMNR